MRRMPGPLPTLLRTATLAVAGSLAVATRTLGVTDPATLVAASPFDFRANALLYVPRAVPQPSSDGFQAAAERELVSLVDAARETARAVARDDGVDAARAQGVRVAPAGAEVEVRETDDTVTVTVTARVHPLPGLAFLPAAEMSADAVTSAEEP